MKFSLTKNTKVEFGKCDFCGEEKSVSRKYIRIKNKHFDDNKKGKYSNFIRYCSDCGIEDEIHNYEDKLDKYKDALIWCSGSEDFQYPDGKARIGWEKLCMPLLK
jgi:hypothetical protein